MKKIVALLLFVLFLLQATQVVKFLFPDCTCVFIMGEEEVEDNGGKLKKDYKDFIASPHGSGEFAPLALIAFHFAETIHHPPCVEKLTPPPNFC